jgi:hypothetical protein
LIITPIPDPLSITVFYRNGYCEYENIVIIKECDEVGISYEGLFSLAGDI